MLSVVCPVYHEAENIERLLGELRVNSAVPMEVIIVYDEEDDNTIPVVQRVLSQYSFAIRLTQNHFGKGVLNAIKSGFSVAHGEAVLLVMADLSDDLAVINEMYRLVTVENFDIVCGSRYMRGGKQVGGPRLKRTLSRLAGVSLYRLAGLPTHDVTNSFKMYRRDFLQDIDIESTGGFEIGIELTVKAFLRGKKIAELPATWTDRVAGKSRFRLWQWLPHYLYWYLYAFRK